MTAGKTSDYGESHVLGSEPIEDSVPLYEHDSATGELLKCHLILGPDDVDQTIKQLYKAHQQDSYRLANSEDDSVAPFIRSLKRTNRYSHP